VDGDGKPDLVVANLNSNTVSVFRNTSTSGSVAFASKVDLTTGPQPQSVAMGDVDGDGKPDLVVTNSDANSVSVFRNISVPGSITASSFASKVDFTTGAHPRGSAISDVDGDSKPDLVVTNGTGNTVSVFRNTSTSGSITFASKVDFTTGTNPSSVAIGDVDGDGKPDLVVANENSFAVSVFWNTVGPATSAEELLNQVPKEYSLSQNYPNPFNPSTVVRFSLPTVGFVSLTVHNVLGLQVAVLVNQVKSPGTYTATLDATGFPSGVYFYRLRVGSFTETKRLVLLK
jgi:6-phosphogluconolactonase (cycloisomerase 2 family)